MLDVDDEWGGNVDDVDIVEFLDTFGTLPGIHGRPSNGFIGCDGNLICECKNCDEPDGVWDGP